MNDALPATPSFLAIALYAALTGGGMLAGVWLMRRYEVWAVRHGGELIAFAAGLLVAGALIHFVDRAVELSGAGAALAWTLVSFLALYVAEAHVVPHTHGRAPSEHGVFAEGRTLGPMVVGGLGLHSVVDGLSVGAGFSVDPLVGWVALVLVVAHKLPEGIASMSALYASGVSGRRAAATTTILALITPLAVIASFLFLKGVGPRTLGALLALTGGAFLYVGAADLLPEGQARGRLANTFFFLAGVAAMVAVKVLE
ncbi:MAG: ZIP family metal transporter [Gemmatimonadetes bacterium]|nr:ZIP family metal transporter [Gemmatimonadota bacterium]